MVWNNKRSEKAELRRKQKREAKRYVFETSWKDRVITEVIEQVTVEQINNQVFIKKQTDEPQVYFASNDWQDGLVLISQLQFAIYQNMILYPAQLSFITESP